MWASLVYIPGGWGGLTTHWTGWVGGAGHEHSCSHSYSSVLFPEEGVKSGPPSSRDTPIEVRHNQDFADIVAITVCTLCMYCIMHVLP